ncbi:MAG: hypothetical protein J6T10_28235 [Methanobrevibacter sp.]|nr:hypothetical protein [Methanobrevibacter sp.]
MTDFICDLVDKYNKDHQEQRMYLFIVRDEYQFNYQDFTTNKMYEFRIPIVNINYDFKIEDIIDRFEELIK